MKMMAMKRGPISTKMVYRYDMLKSIPCSMGVAPSFIIYRRTLLSTDDKKLDTDPVDCSRMTF
jgi:hypothetical protein